MPTWITLVSDDLRDREVAAMVQALRGAALGEGQTDPVPQLIDGAVARVRAAIASAAGNVLDPQPGSIPHSLKELTVRLVLRAAKGRLNVALEPDEVRDAQWDERTLREVALGHLRVEHPAADEEAGFSRGGARVESFPSCEPHRGLAGLGAL